MSAHDSYLINLASPDQILRARSLESFTSELRRCEALGLDYLVSHPGNFMDDRASGVARNAEAIAIALEAVPGNVMILMETTAGSGTAIGANFEEMRQLDRARSRRHIASASESASTPRTYSPRATTSHRTTMESCNASTT